MKASKFSQVQIAFVLKQAEDGTRVGDVCRNARNKAGLTPSEMKRLLQLEEENATLSGLWWTCPSTRPCCQKSSMAG